MLMFSVVFCLFTIANSGPCLFTQVQLHVQVFCINDTSLFSCIHRAKHPVNVHIWAGNKSQRGY